MKSKHNNPKIPVNLSVAAALNSNNSSFSNHEYANSNYLNSISKNNFNKEKSKQLSKDCLDKNNQNNQKMGQKISKVPYLIKSSDEKGNSTCLVTSKSLFDYDKFQTCTKNNSNTSSNCSNDQETALQKDSNYTYLKYSISFPNSFQLALTSSSNLSTNQKNISIVTENFNDKQTTSASTTPSYTTSLSSSSSSSAANTNKADNISQSLSIDNENSSYSSVNQNSSASISSENISSASTAFASSVSNLTNSNNIAKNEIENRLSTSSTLSSISSINSSVPNSSIRRTCSNRYYQSDLANVIVR